MENSLLKKKQLTLFFLSRLNFLRAKIRSDNIYCMLGLGVKPGYLVKAPHRPCLHRLNAQDTGSCNHLPGATLGKCLGDSSGLRDNQFIHCCILRAWHSVRFIGNAFPRNHPQCLCPGSGPPGCECVCVYMCLYVCVCIQVYVCVFSTILIVVRCDNYCVMSIPMKQLTGLCCCVPWVCKSTQDVITFSDTVV